MRAMALVSTPASSAVSNAMESMLYNRRLDSITAEADFEASRAAKASMSAANLVAVDGMGDAQFVSPGGGDDLARGHQREGRLFRHRAAQNGHHDGGHKPD